MLKKRVMEDLLRYNAAILPQKRSSFNKSHSHVTTFDSGYLVPLMWDRVLPGDEKKIRYSGLARMATPYHPVMDNANLDVWCFFVPDRLWWEHAKEFYGENKDASFNPDGTYVMPYLDFGKYSVKVAGSDAFVSNEGVGSLNDYFGFPVRYDTAIGNSYDNIPEFRASAGLHRCYQLIWNDCYRNSSIQPALQLSTGDTVSADEWNVIKQIRKVCKYPDYFTSLLREPQAGDDVTLPLGDWAPVVTRADRVPYDSWVRGVGVGDLTGSEALTLATGAGGGNIVSAHTSNRLLAQGEAINGLHPLIGTPSTFENEDIGTHYMAPANLWADLTSATASTINNLRAAITVQQLLEIDSMAGKRYQQILQAHFGVFTPDATLQRPELLGTTRTMVGMRQVLQTSASEDGSPQGNTAAFSLTDINNEWICNKAFTEPGFIMVLGAVRPYHSYSQGLDPLLTKLNRYDHYWPVFDNLGNQPVPLSAVYCMTDFIKKLRNKFRDAQIDYYYSGEYGDQQFRPHFHMIGYNFFIPDLEFWKLNDNGDPIYTSEILHGLWKKGIVAVSNYSWRGAAYTASYVEKKRDGRLQIEYEAVGLTPEKSRMSRRPGIAHDYYVEHFEDIWKNNGLNVSRDVNKSGHLGIPRYFRKLAEKYGHDDLLLDFQKRSLERSNVLAPLELRNSSFDLNSIGDMLAFEEREILSRKVNKKL